MDKTVLIANMLIGYHFDLLLSQVEGQVTPVNLPSSRGLSTPGSPASTITVRHTPADAHTRVVSMRPHEC